MPYTFNPFTGNFDNTPSTLKGDSAYSTVLPNSADWTDGYQTGTVYKANSATYATSSFVQSNFLPLSGGVVDGPLEAGTGSVTLFISGNKIGVNTEVPNQSLTVVGNISSDNVIYSNNGNSDQWSSAYTSVNANSATYATIDFANNKFFPLSGGQITGNTRINGNVTIFGDLTSTGTQTFANTIFTTTSSLSIVHIGSGPAFWVGNNGSGDIASFNDIDQGIEVLHIGGANGDFPNVGVKTSSPNKDFTVKGEISATGDIWTTGRILSGNQELASIFRPDIDKGLSVFNTVQSNSATNWNYQGTDLKNLSAQWVGGNAAFTNLVSNSAAYLSSVDLSFLSVSANWNSTYNTVLANSATNWNYQGTDLKDLSANWQNTYTNYSANSASYATLSSVGSNFYPLTGGTLNGSITASTGSFTNILVAEQDPGDAVLYASNYKVGINTELPNQALTVVGSISATEIYYGNGSGLTNVGNAAVNSWVIANSANATFNSVSAISLSGTFYGDGSNLIGASLPGQADINTLVRSNSASWNYQATDLKNLSSGWVGGNAAFTNLVSNSAAYLSSVDLSFLSVSANWNSVYNTVRSASANYILDGGNTKGSNISIGTNDAFNLSLETSGTSRLTILSSGNIGINETSPEGKLHVTAGSAGTVVAQPSSVGVFESGGNAYLSLLSPTSHYAGVIMGGPTNPYGSYVSWNHDNLALKLATNHAGASIQMLAGTEQEALRITSTGNVGIGTTSPSEKLTVSGNISASGNLYGNAASLTNVIDSGVRSLSGNWQTGYEYATAYSNASGSLVTYEVGDVIKPRGAIVGSASDSNVVDVSQTVLDIKSLIYGVQITTSPDQVNLYTWNFNPDGSLTYPDNTSQTTAFTGIPSYVESTYTTVQSNSASWDYQGTDLKDLSASWQNTFTDFSSNSASYATSSFVQGNFLPLSGGNVSGNFEVGFGSATLFVSSGLVGIHTEAPNKELTVVGSISATNTIYTNYLELSDVKFTNEHLSNVSSITASNDFLKVIVGNNTKYLRLYDVE